MAKTTTQDKVEPEFEPKLETLSGDIRDWLLDRFRLLDKPWTKLSELEQRRLNESADEMARVAIRRTVSLISKYEWPTVAVRFAAEGSFKDGEITVKVTTGATGENLARLAAGAGQATLVMINPATFFGQRKPAEVQPDQPDMDLGEAEAGTDGLSPEEALKRFGEAKDAVAEKTKRGGRARASRETADA